MARHQDNDREEDPRFEQEVSSSDDDDAALQLDDELEQLAQAAEVAVLNRVAKAPDDEVAAGVGSSRATEGDREAGKGKKEKRKKMRWKNRKTAFVNQLPYSATEEQVTAHFGGIAAPSEMEVRMVTNRKTNKFRGIAFVDLCSTEALEKALALNQSTFTNADGERQINVTEAHSRDDDKKLTKAQKNKREMSKEGTAEVDALISREVAAGTVKQDDFDYRALDFLHSAPHAVALQAVADFVALDKSTVKNRCVSPARHRRHRRT